MIIRKLEALFTINTNAAQFKKATSQLDQFSKKAENIMKTIAGYWAVQALQNFVANTAKAMDEIGKNAKFLGITTDALQELRYAAEKSGLSIDGLEDALKELQIRAVDALSGSGEAFESFDKLSVKTTDVAGKVREPLDLLVEVADQLQKLPTHAERLWVVDSMFGDEGSKMLMMMHHGSAGLRKLREEARALGITISAEGITKAGKFSQALHGMKTHSQGLSNAFIDGLLGPLSWLMEKVSALTSAFNQLEGRAAVVRVVLTTLGGIVTALAIKAALIAAPFIAPFLPLIGIITAASVVLEDLWGAFKGRDSLIASVFGSMYNNIAEFASQASLALTKGFADAFKSINKEFAKFSDWLSNGLAQLVQKANEFIVGLVPDFLKNGFLAKVQHILPVEGSHYGPHRLNTRLAPSAASIAPQHRITSNQSVSVAVNVKSGADPHEIGGEVSKAVRRELERERFNAFMGVTQYAG